MQKPKLLDQVRNLMRLRHLSHKTERAYISYIREYILFHHKRRPKDLGVNEIRDYLTPLAVERKVVASTQNVAFNALLFLYKQVLRIEDNNRFFLCVKFSHISFGGVVYLTFFFPHRFFLLLDPGCRSESVSFRVVRLNSS